MFVSDHWEIRKPAIVSDKGLVAAQEGEAAAAGAAILAAGGNAVDAAVATALALGCTEPWMSGIGGGGFMLVHLAAERRTHAVEFGMVSPAALDPGRYALATGEGPEEGLFVWPRVVEDRNIFGAEAVCVPGAVAGLSLALERFGTRPWAEVIAPAIELADRGLAVSWYNTLQIAYGAAAGLGRYATTRETYLPGGAPPTSLTPHEPKRVRLGNLPATLRRLAEAGPRDFYEGEIARRIVHDMQAAGGALSLDDLAGYRANVVEPMALAYRDATVHLVPGLNGSPTFARALRRIAETLDPGRGLGPDAYLAYAEALREAYAFRFEHLGHDGDPQLLGCTTHLSVIDAAGNMVALTNTLLERFGSRLMLPETGILMNNGMMWFDPRPGRPNSIAPGRRPLSNMCPVLATHGDGRGWFALGASGGRRIVPACFQLTSMLIDFGMSMDEAWNAPRIDVSGTETVVCDGRLDSATVDALAARFPVTVTEQAVLPNMFATPQGVMRLDGRNCAAARVQTPTATVAVAER